jgi:hypothetical protein
MRPIRKLSFQNAAGDRWGLNGDRGVYASNLAGFGLSLSPNFADLGQGFFVSVNDESEPQGSLPFTLTFTKAPYETYKILVDWLAAAGSITIVYDPAGKQEYCRDVTISFLEKGELNPVGWLEVPGSFLCNTPWYLPKPTAIDLESTGVDESKRYDYSYTEDLRYGTDSSASLSTTVVGAGHKPGALLLKYYGAITNPRLRLTGDVSGKTFGICSINVIMDEFDMLEVSTRYENSYVKRISPTGAETDLLDALDLSSQPFFHIPVNEPCTLTIEADAPFHGLAELLVYYYYRSV